MRGIGEDVRPLGFGLEVAEAAEGLGEFLRELGLGLADRVKLFFVLLCRCVEGFVEGAFEGGSPGGGKGVVDFGEFGIPGGGELSEYLRAAFEGVWHY